MYRKKWKRKKWKVDLANKELMIKLSDLVDQCNTPVQWVCFPSILFFFFVLNILRNILLVILELKEMSELMN